MFWTILGILFVIILIGIGIFLVVGGILGKFPTSSEKLDPSSRFIAILFGTVSLLNVYLTANKMF